jgi:hypothetical protein
MAIERRRKADEKVTPFSDVNFRKPSLDAGTMLDRRQFEENLIRYKIMERLTTLEEDVDNVITGETTIIQTTVTAPDASCYWTRVGNDVWYTGGDVYCRYELRLETKSNTARDPVIKFGVGDPSVVKFTVGVDDSDSDSFKIEQAAALSGGDYVRYLSGVLQLQDSTSAPTFELINLSDTARDPMVQYTVGATPSIKWTHGLDDSDLDKWKLANTTALGTATSNSYSYGTTLYYGHGLDDVHGVLLSDFSTDSIYITGGTGSGDGQFDHPRQIAFDGTYLYIADDVNNRVQKFLASDGSFISKTTFTLLRPWGCIYYGGFVYVTYNSGTGTTKIIKFDAETMVYQSTFGSFGSGDDNFNQPRSMATDGDYLYICDSANSRIKKHTLEGTYVSQIGEFGTGNGQFKLPTGIATDGTYLYVADYTNKRIQILNCSDLTYVAQVSTQLREGIGGSPTSVTLNGTCFYVTCLNSMPYSGYIEKYDIATRTFQAFFDPTGNAADSYGTVILQYKASHGDLIVAYEDGTFVDIYPKTRFFDSVRLYEGSVETGEYVGIRTPTDITASYHLTLPSAVSSTKATPYVSSGGTIGWGQNVDTDGSPTFANITDAGLTATHPVFTDADKLLVSTGTIPVDHGGTGLTSYAVGDLIYASAGTTLSKLVDVAAGAYLRSGGITTAPLWSTLILPNAATAYRLPVATSANTIGELVAVGATGEYLAGATGAIPSWATLNQAAVAGLTTTDGPSFDHLHLTVAIGTAPLAVTSTTLVSNLNVQYLNNIESTGFINRHVEATATPGVNDDITNYLEGTIWIEQDANKAYILVDNTDGNAVWTEIGAGGGASAFIDLTDVDEADYSGHAGQFVVVNGTADGLIFTASSVAEHDILSLSHGDTVASAVSRGSIIIGNDTPKWVELPVGTVGQVLTTDGTDVLWDDPPAAAAHDLLSATHSDTTAGAVTRGAMIAGIGATPKWEAIAAGTEGHVWTMGADEPGWAAPAGGGAPTDAQYVCLAVDAGLSAERVLTAGVGISIADAGAGSSVTLDAQHTHKHIVETFDALATGAIDGLGSYYQCGAWATTADAGCTATVAVKSGADKMLRCYAPAGAGNVNTVLTLSSTIGLSGGFRIRFKIRSDNDVTGNSGGILVANAAGTTVASVRMGYSTGWKLRFYDGSTTTNIQVAAKNTWYQIDMFVSDIAATTGEARIFIDGVYATSLITGSCAASWNTIKAYATNAGASAINMDYDDLCVYSLMPLFTEI